MMWFWSHNKQVLLYVGLSPAQTGGRSDLYYRVEHSDPDNLGSFTGTVYKSGGSTSHTFTGLRPYTQYCIRVSAHNGSE